jgi:malonyl-CoA O-methyltransferase
MKGVFVTGTDTGVGKTVVSACLVRAWGADYWKPVQTGLDEDEGDTAVVARLSEAGPERLHAPAYAFGPPVSPHLAADRAGVEISLDRLTLPASPRPMVVEGAGGALVPLNGRERMIDLMAAFGLPVVVVAADRLGAINHALLTLETFSARSLTVAGVILTGGPFADNAAAVATHGRTRVLARLPWAETLDAAAVAAWAGLMPSLGELA